MPNLGRPDVYLTEVTLPQLQQFNSSQAVAAFLGTAPQGSNVVPTLLNSWQDYITNFGGIPTSDPNNGDLAYAVYQYFANGGRQAYALRCTATASPAVAGTKNLVDRAATPANTLAVNAISPGAWGNNIYVGIADRDAPNGRFDLLVYRGGSTSQFVVERFTDLSMVNSDPRWVQNIVNSAIAGSALIRVTDLASATTAPNDTPSLNGGVPSQLTTGADGGSPTAADLTTALALFNSVPGPVLLNVPGNTTASVVNGAIAYAEGRGDAFVIIDSPKPTDATAGGVANAVTVSSAFTVSSYAAVYYPWLHMIDPNAIGSGSTRPTAPGGAVAGVYARTDQVRGVFHAPAGVSTGTLTGAVSQAKDLGTSAALTNADYDTLNNAYINAIRNLPGIGLTVFGTRTLWKSGITRFIAPRRTLIFLKQALRQATQFAVFENNDANLWSQLSTVCLRIVGNLWQQGGLSGANPQQAYFVICDSSINTPAVVAGGEVKVQVGVALQVPAEFVTITLTQYDGGSSVTDTTNVAT